MLRLGRILRRTLLAEGNAAGPVTTTRRGLVHPIVIRCPLFRPSVHRVRIQGQWGMRESGPLSCVMLHTGNSCVPRVGSGWSRSRLGQQHARDAAAAWRPRAVYPPPPPEPVQPSAGSELRDAPKRGGWQVAGGRVPPRHRGVCSLMPPSHPCRCCHPPEAPPASVHPSTSPSLLQRSQGARCSRHPPPRRHAPTITHWCVCLPRHRVTVPRRRTRLPTTPLPQASRLFPSWRRPPRLWAPLLLRRQLLPLPPSCRLLCRPCLRTFGASLFALALWCSSLPYWYRSVCAGILQSILLCL